MRNIIFVFGFVFIIHLYDIKNIRMVEFFSRINNGFIIQFINIPIGVLNGNIIDHSTRIRSCQNQTDLTNNTMLDVTTILTQMVCINRQGIDVSMGYEFPCLLCSRRIIEHAIAINTIITILEQCMTENVIRRIMIMLPNKGDHVSILFSKCIVHDRTTIRATNVVLSRVTAEITLHWLDSFIFICKFLY